MQRVNDWTERGSVAKLPWGVVKSSSFVLAGFVMLGCGPAFSMAEGKADADGASDVAKSDVAPDRSDELLDGSVSESDVESARDSASDGALDSEFDTDGPLRCEDGEKQCDGLTYKWCEDGVWKTQVCDSSTHKCDKDLGGCYRNTCKPACSGNQFCRDDNRCSSKVFETEWEVKEGGVTITLPYYDEAPGAKCDFRVLWGDEPDTSDFSEAQEVTACKQLGVKHTYEKKGNYRVKILGTYIGWGQKQGDQVSLKQLRKVVSFGPVGLTQYAFYGIGDVGFPTDDVPDATKLTNAKSMFETAADGSYAIANWDTSNTEDMSRMFFNASKFYPQVKSWKLKRDVRLTDIFKGSAMDEKGVCELLEDPEWEKNEKDLGVKCTSRPPKPQTVFVH